MLNIKNNIGSLPEGAYVWKKYEHNQLKQEDKTSVYVSTGVEPNDSYNYIYSTSYTVDYATGTFTLENPQTYSGNVTLSSDPPIAGKYIIAISSDKLGTYISDDLKTSGKELLFIPTDASYRTSGSPAGRIVSKATSYTVSTIGDFLDFVISDSPTAYPDGGEQGGYWYEKVVEGIPLPDGITKFAVDKFTLTSGQAANIDLSHSLGDSPVFAILSNEYIKSNASSKVGKAMILGGRTDSSNNAYYAFNDCRGIATNSGTATISETAINLGRPDAQYIAGHEYTLITMA